MLKFVILVAIVAAASARPGPGDDVQIVRQSQDSDGAGNFKYGFETSDGTKSDATGTFRAGPGPDEGNLEVSGSSSYISPEGKEIKTVYSAGANGYVAQGDHIPTPHPIPEAIQKALAYNAAHPEEDNLK